ncbi:MAG: hypothetical protein UD299_09395 [Ruminococcus sp.]|nr:hypothetical protein [Ruminococcus sp.]
MWATRPHLANIFKKLLDQKTFICLWLEFYNHHIMFSMHKKTSLLWEAFLL